MSETILTTSSLVKDLQRLGVEPGDGLFVHSSFRTIGPVIGGPRAIVAALLEVVGPEGLVGMPGFSTDAYFPSHMDTEGLPEDVIAEIEQAVPGFDPALSPTAGMGVIAETFRRWPGTRRSSHPASSICLNGKHADEYTRSHALDWAYGADTPMGKLLKRENMKLLLAGVGWNRCSALHTAETLAEHRRTKTRRFKLGAQDAGWIETSDVADDFGRLFPAIGSAFEADGAVVTGMLGRASCKICDYTALVDFAREWISNANLVSGDTC